MTDALDTAIEESEKADDLHENTHSLDTALAYRIHRTARLLRYNLTNTLQRMETELTPEQWFILFRLYEQDGVTQAQLADKFLNDRSNITRLLDSLEKREFVVRAANPEDRRSHRIFITKAGRDFVCGLLPHIIEHRKSIFQDIPLSSIEQLVGVLDKVEKNLTKKIK